MLLASKTSNLYNLPIGRATFAMQDMHTRALDLGRDDMARVIAIARDDTRFAMELALSFRAGHTGLYSPAAVKMDGVVDHTVVGTEGYLRIQIRLYPGQPRGEAAERLLRILFPDGVAAVTRLPFAEEHAQIATILRRAAAPDLADDIALLPELPEMLQLLAERNREYGEALSNASRAPTRADVREALDRSQERVAEIVFYIISHYNLLEPDKADERDHLLEPIVTQNEATRLTRRRRRSPVDIDPETGEEVDEGPGLDDDDDDDDDADLARDDDAAIVGDETGEAAADESEAETAAASV